MILSRNIKQYRKERGISQEYMAAKLHMHQTTYHRLEQNECACARNLSRIADALGATPEILQTHHLTQYGQGDLELAGWATALLVEKDTIIQEQTDKLHFLNCYVDYLQAIWKEYGQVVSGSGNHTDSLRISKRPVINL